MLLAIKPLKRRIPASFYVFVYAGGCNFRWKHMFTFNCKKKECVPFWHCESLSVFPEGSIPAASLNNPVRSVHSGACGSASALSPEAVETEREGDTVRETHRSIRRAKANSNVIVSMWTQDMLPCSYPSTRRRGEKTYTNRACPSFNLFKSTSNLQHPLLYQWQQTEQTL